MQPLLSLCRGGGRSCRTGRTCQTSPICGAPHATGLGEPAAGGGEVQSGVPHHQVYGAQGVVHAHPAAALVPPLAEGEAGVVVVVEGAEGPVPRHLHPQPGGHLLYGQVAQFLNLVFFHVLLFFFFRLVGRVGLVGLVRFFRHVRIVRPVTSPCARRSWCRAPSGQSR